MPVIDQEIHERYALYHGDNMEVLPDLKPESIGFCCHSPPFAELYSYSNDPRDMSNCVTYEEALEQYRYVVREMFRVNKKGRLSAVHCMDLKQGQLYQKDFPGDIVRVYEESGWKFFCRVTIWKDAWQVAKRTRLRTLMHKTLVEDSSKSRIAGADYVLVFRKPGDNAEPIRHPYGLKSYAGERSVPEDLRVRYRDYKGDQRKNKLSHWIYQQYASPVWMDIRPGRLLSFEDARDSDEEAHVCALQLDVIERCLTLWSNPDDIVLSPFMGVGSEIHQAVAMGRRGIGCELKDSYFRQAKKNVAAALEVKSEGQQELPFGLQSSPEQTVVSEEATSS